MKAKKQNKPAERKYTITVTEEQAHALQNACEVAARIGMYQLHDICRFLPQKSKVEQVSADEIYHQPWDMYLHYTQQATDDRQKPLETVVLWDLYQVIRHRLSWDAHPEGDNSSVMFDAPLRMGRVPLAKIEAVEE